MLGIDHFSGDLTRYSPTGSADRMSAQGQSHVGFRRVRRWKQSKTSQLLLTLMRRSMS